MNNEIDEAGWLNDQATVIVTNLASKALGRLGPVLGMEEFELDDAFTYARKTFGKALAQYKHLLSESKTLEPWQVDLFAGRLAEKVLYSANTRRVISRKITEAMKTRRAKDADNGAKGDIGHVEKPVWSQ